MFIVSAIKPTEKAIKMENIKIEQKTYLLSECIERTYYMQDSDEPALAYVKLDDDGRVIYSWCDDFEFWTEYSKDGLLIRYEDTEGLIVKYEYDDCGTSIKSYSNDWSREVNIEDATVEETKEILINATNFLYVYGRYEQDGVTYINKSNERI